ncbi:uncharacterized protein METZ01_LOCUS392043 [marine metagenome]|uniref:Zinc finger CHC2-type domain-containing protein n=1 Tax=marine metagenome TaxID=408172 RepID=A0A382UY75_9ZZZZ
MSNPIDKLLLQLDDAIETGHGRWRAKCPGHNSRSRTLSIAEGAEGAVLIHCFAGCEPAQIVSAVGLRLCDLFPRNETIQSKRYNSRPRTDYKALVELLRHEITVLIVAAEAVRNNEILPDEELEVLYRVLRNLGMVRNA